MGRYFPRFLLSRSTQAKSKGTFIIHTLDPGFIAEPTFDEARRIIDIHVVHVFEQGTFYQEKAKEIAEKEIQKWWKYSGIHDSCDPRDRLISKLSALSFLRDNSSQFTVDQATEVIKILYPTKAKRLNTDVSSYGIKHDLERLSLLFLPGLSTKYCSNDTIKEAFAKEGFKHSSDGPNEFYNISEKECHLVRKIAFYLVNNPKVEASL
jgi:hypothetical protein